METAQKDQRRVLPNIVVILTDDLDLTLGGSHASTLSQTRALFREGRILSNWMAHTPVCCPSRAQLLTGRMFHNLQGDPISTSSATAPRQQQQQQQQQHSCMHVNVSGSDPQSPFYHDYYFAPHFASHNYTVGVFGKHLNQENPIDFVPAGVDYWMVNGGGSYANPSFRQGTSGAAALNDVTFDNCTSTEDHQEIPIPCYSTSVIGNSSLAWIRRHLQSQQQQQAEHHQPFFALISVKAPHIQDDNDPTFPMSEPAPWYQNVSIPEESRAPRTVHYNRSCPDHHWLVKQQTPLSELEGDKVDQLYTSRLRALLSVDDLVVDLFDLLSSSSSSSHESVLVNTVVVFTSDHGYRLGQLQMPQGKFHAYENDIRVPMMIRGPGIMTRSDDDGVIMGTHVDLMPTLMGLAHGDSSQSIVPSAMDGTNLAGALMQSSRATTATVEDSPQTNDNNDSRIIPPPSHLPTSTIIEYVSLGNVVRYQHLEDTFNHSFLALRVWDTDRPMGTPFRNIKYIEYRDVRQDPQINSRSQRRHHGHDPSSPVFLERELFDLDNDPLELINLIGNTSRQVLQKMHDKLMRLYHCRGDDCREERCMGLVNYAGVDDDTLKKMD